MGFDPITMAATISKLKANGQIGSDNKTALTFNGNINTIHHVEVIPGAMYLIKLSDECFEPFEFVEMQLKHNDAIFTYSKKEIIFETTETGWSALSNGTPMLYGMREDTNMEGVDLAKGVWGQALYSDELTQYPVSITLGEVKPIDPKYLPGLTLPVVELSEETATAMMGGGEPTLTDEEAAKLDSLLLTYAPFMLTAKMQGAVAGVCMCQYALDFSSFMPTYAGCMYYYAEGGVNLSGFRFKKTESGWIARMISGIAYQR